MFRTIPLLLAGFLFVVPLFPLRAQSLDDSVRVTVTMNPDGSKTVYQVDPLKGESVATTTSANGKPVGKIIYRLDSQGRYETGQVFGPDGKWRFKTAYKYDPGGRLAEESQMGKDDSLHSKIVYSYDAVGHQTGYAIYDGNGKLIGRTTPKKAKDDRRGDSPRGR